jgi:hypothetical protein
MERDPDPGRQKVKAPVWTRNTAEAYYQCCGAGETVIKLHPGTVIKNYCSGSLLFYQGLEEI